MKNQTARNGALAAVALGALTIYILACTSFSPDDKKILYPAFDSSGAVSMAVYDREQRNSELVFTPIDFEVDETQVRPRTDNFLRGQWLPDGRRIALVWSEEQQDGNPTIALVPWGTKGEVRLFRLGALNPEASHFAINPLCIINERLLFVSSDRRLVRLDLRSGQAVSHQLEQTGGELSLYPAFQGDPFYVQEKPDDAGIEFGRLNSETFQRMPLMVITNEPVEMSFFTYNRDGTAVALVEEDEQDRQVLVVLQKGKPLLRKMIPPGQGERRFGQAQFHPDGKRVIATCREDLETERYAYSLMEIPLGEGSVRQTRLLEARGRADDETVLYFQAGVSNDGKTAAVSSTYLALSHAELAPKDCALFLIDLSDPDRKITRVPIPLPVGAGAKKN